MTKNGCGQPRRNDHSGSEAGLKAYFRPSFCFTWAVTSVERVVEM